MKALKPALEVVELKDAQHHLFLDQPLAFIDTLQAIVRGWR